MVVGPEFRKYACVTFFHSIRWDEIESYEWKPSFKDYWRLFIKRRNISLPIWGTFRGEQKALADQILKEILAQR